MSNPVPPDRRPPRLREDEPIALFVVFLVFGSLLAWGLGLGRNGMDWTQLWAGVQKTWQTQPGRSGATPQPPAPDAAESPRSPTPSATITAPSPSTPSPGTPTGTTNLGVGGTTEGAAATGEAAMNGSPTPLQPAPSPESAPPSAVTQPGKPLDFADVPKEYWAAPFISALSAKGIISGFPDGTFKPNQPVTRAEFAVQVQKAFTKPDRSPTKSFADVPPGSKWSVAVDQAVKAGFMTGYPDRTFRPEQDVSRTEAVIAIVKGLEIPVPSDPTAVLQPYADQQGVPGWARSPVAAAIQKRIFTGNPDTNQLMAEQPATRADIAALIYKSLEVEAK